MSYSGRMGTRSTSKRLPRHLRNEDLPRDMFTPRTYQVELLDSARRRNTVVCMGSSSGRMFIAVMLMKEMAVEIRRPLADGGKRSIYLVNSDEMVEQQSPSIQHPANVALGVYTSKLGIDDWTEDKWKQEIDRSEALIMTGAMFLSLLQRSILSLASINLLIIDDCHLTLKDDHPYKHIMTIYKTIQEHEKPRILGLTSNILHGQVLNPEILENLVSSLEEALQSTAETSTLVISERYGLRIRENVVECDDYEDTTGLNDELYILLERAIDFLEECNMKPSEDTDNRDLCLIPRAALVECHNMLTQLGPWCTACLADMLVGQLEKIEKNKESNTLHKRFFRMAATTLRMVSTIFEKHFRLCEYSVEELLRYSTPKVTRLMDCLRKFRPQTDFVIISEEVNHDDLDDLDDSDMSDDDDLDLSDNDNDEENDPKSTSPKQVHVAVKKLPPENETKAADPFSLEEDKYLCGVVFVENQHEAYALNKFIEEVCSWDEGLCFVKSHHLTAGKGSTGSGVRKERKLYKRQEEVLRRFRMQELNLLVATSVLEEGVDVPKCNLVVRFDVPKNYRSYSQSKGRARARDAEYILLIEEENYDEFQAQLKLYKQIEEVLIRQCNKVQEDLANEVGDSACDTDIQPYVPSSVESHIKVTLETSIMLVNRYCAKLPSDAFTHLTPSCTVMEVEQDGQTLYMATLRLPINSPIKDEIEGAVMSTKQKARKAVALKMCEILHNQGELDDHLMPVGKEMFQGEDWEEEDILEEEDDMLGEARPGTTKRKQYYTKKVASALLQSHPLADTPCYLYIIHMTLTGAITEDQNTRGRKIYAPEDTPRGFGILTSKAIPLVPKFPVFTRSGEVTVSIELQAEMLLSMDELARLKTFHRFLFGNVLRLEKDPMDYQPCDSTMGYVVVPLNRADGSADIEIDWSFTGKVETSVGVSTKAKKAGETFVFNQEDFEDAVVMPSYRNIDQPQYFYVAEIRYDLNPLSPFPSPELYKTFAEYYTTKYGLTITNLDQPLLDVDHTSARLNLLIPRYMNQKGVPLPTSSAETKKARRENLQQKQILIPELCDIHVFLASLWKKAVCLPAILYRMNYLLLAEEIRKHVSKETKIGVSELPEGYRFPRLDFGFDTSPESLKPLNGSGGESEDKASDENEGWDQANDEETKEEDDNQSKESSNQISNGEDDVGGTENDKSVNQLSNGEEEAISDISKDGKDKVNTIEEDNKLTDDDDTAGKDSHIKKDGERETASQPGMAEEKDETAIQPASFSSPLPGTGDTAGKYSHIMKDGEGETARQLASFSTPLPVPDKGVENEAAAGHTSKDETVAANNNCDNTPTQCNISSTETAAHATAKGENAVLTDQPKCNNKFEDEPVAIGGIEFDIYAKDDLLDKDCDKRDPFRDPPASFQSADKAGPGEKTAGAGDGDPQTDTCELCSKANRDIQFLGIVNLTLSSCPKCSPAKTIEMEDELRPKIVELPNDSPAEALKKNKHSELVNGFAEPSAISGDSDTASKPTVMQNGLQSSDEEENENSKPMNSAEKQPDLADDSLTKLPEQNGANNLKHIENTSECCSQATRLNRINDILTAATRDNKCSTPSPAEQNGMREEASDKTGLETSANHSTKDLNEDSNQKDVALDDATDGCTEVNRESETNAESDDALQHRSELPEISHPNMQDTDADADVFSNIGEFMPEERAADKVEEEVKPGPAIPLISLDQDIELASFIGPSPCDILQALTMSNANDFFSLERLETIGDSFLKYAITVYLYCSYPGIHEGKLSYLRSKQVSNYNLYRQGKRKGLSECMISTKFEPYENWLPPGFTINEDKRKGPVPKVQVATLSKSSSMIFSSLPADNLSRSSSTLDINGLPANHKIEMKKFSRELEEIDLISQAKDEEFAKGDKPDNGKPWSPYSLQLHHCLPDKSIADCVEALIGCYLTSCDKMAALLFMSWMGLKVLPRRLKDSPSAIEGLDVDYDRLPCPKSPFLSASRNADQVLARLLSGYESFEEKIGYQFRDRAYLLQAFTHASYHYNTVTDCYQRLEFLGDAVLDYVITRHLYEDSDKYSPGVLTDLRSALVNNNIFAALAVKWDLHKYFKAISPALFNVIEKFVARQKENEDEIDLEDDEADGDQEKEHMELEVPKALGDIFESVAGAIYLDSGMSLDGVWGVFYKIMKPQIDKYLKNIPKSPVRELLEQEPETAKFDKPERTMDGKIRVTVNVVGKGVFTGVGRNYRIAKSAAAKKALKCIKTLEAEGLV